MFSDSILLSLLRRIKLPDVEFWMNLGDWPHQKIKGKDRQGLKMGRDQSRLRKGLGLIPAGSFPTLGRLALIVSWCGHIDTADIVVPTYDVMEGTVDMMSRVTRDQFSVQSFGRQVKWADKIDKAFFRGRDSRQERLDLAHMSLQYPDMINASITNYFFFKGKTDNCY